MAKRVQYRHGNSAGYIHDKCRCDECKAWKKERDRDYYERKGGEVRERSRRFRQENPERVREYRKVWRERYPEKYEAAKRYWTEYQKENAEQANLKNRKWRAQNRWKAWFYNWRGRELARGQVYAPEVLEWIKNLNSPPCSYCGEVAETMDHLIPRIEGGTNDRANLRPACHRCNRRKGCLPFEEFMRRLREEY
jgi:5-methylcytosine-specific restriction endonuclease McrA